VRHKAPTAPTATTPASPPHFEFRFAKVMYQQCIKSYCCSHFPWA